MSRSRLVLAASALLVGAGTFLVARTAVGADDPVAGVTASCKEFKAAWNQHDAKALAAVFTDDATHLDPFGKMDEGKPAIEKMLVEAMGPKGPFRESSIVVQTEVVRFAGPDVAVTDAEATVSGAYGPDGTKGGPMDLHVTNVWKKVGGSWRVWACRPYLKPAAPAH
jgi:uncharacterized protein (TIGR02246 family)